ncbi:MAG TPA: hypothetical protein PLJ21_10745 [Pseudobdellovibrionaceae bacterium]|nr:hypothetical protein [Pseudobdellovibrionaceae bacterium]
MKFIFNVSEFSCFRYLGILVVFFTISVFGQVNYLASPIQKLSLDWKKLEGHSTPMPTPYSEESQNINFCYGFSAATLINQMLYVKKAEAYQPISLLDLSTNGLGMGIIEMGLGENMEPKPVFDDLGNFYRVLIYGSLKRRVALESCLPFDRLNILKSSNPKRTDDIKNFLQLLASPFSNDPSITMDISSAADKILTLEPKLGLSKMDIEDKLAKAKVQSFDDLLSLMAKILVPNNCIKERVEIPEYTVTQIKLNFLNRPHISKYFMDILNRNRPLSWAFCINSVCDQQHVLLIAGWRKICGIDSNECRLQFLLRDSGTQVFATAGDYWVDESVIHKKMDVMLGNYEELKSKNMLPDMIANLEY